MGRTIIAALGLVALWLLMSGLYKPLILFLGSLSILLSLWIGKRMDDADGEKLNYALRPLNIFSYTIWLFKEIAKSNWAVAKIILSGKEPKNQSLFLFPVTQKGEVGQVVFANSITLTPGTITVETEGNCFLVHALDFQDGDMDDLKEMDRRVSAIESENAGADV